MKMIKFGTDGWRGLIARDYTFENVRYVSLATAKYLNRKYPNGAKAVVGYDTRFLSREFAEEVAKVLASKGVKTMISDKISTTPQVSFHTKHQDANIGVVITASHNPPQYSGFKLKGSFGGPSTPDEVAEVEEVLQPILEEKPEITLDALSDYEKAGLIQKFDMKKPYVDYVKEKIDFEKIKKAGFKVLYDPMHGAAIDTIKEFLPDADEIHGDYNPGFGEVDHPEPIGSMLPQMEELMKSGKYDVGIATDGDADRVGLFDEKGNFVDSHRVFVLIMKYLYEKRGERGAVAKTVSLTTMVDKYCEKKGIKLFKTPVGFKHITKLMNDETILIGGEESGGLGTIIHIPERDGLFNAFLILEIMAEEGKSLKELCDGLDAEFGSHRYARRDVRVSPEQKEEISAACAKEPKKLGEYDVREIDKTDGYKFFVDNGWLLIRASGTEPLFRFYAEAENLDKVNELLDAGLALK